MSQRKKLRRVPGDVIAIPLGDRTCGYGRVLREPLVAFYDLRSNETLPLERIVCAPVAFVLLVMNYPITDGLWPVIGNARLTKELLDEPLFFKKDPLSGGLTIYRDSTGEEVAGTRQQCEELECAAVWELDHIVDRLRDHFAGRPNKWVESLKA